jgi:hypothetical protein
VSDHKNDPRTPRELNTREDHMRIESWAPPDMLPAPVEQAGYGYRYVRTAVLGEDDPVNVGRSRREGWEPVLASEQPHIAAALSDSRAKYKGYIEIGGLLLCKAPLEFIRQRTAYYTRMTQGQMQAVDNTLMKENDARMPLFKESKTKVTFGSGGT